MSEKKESYSLHSEEVETESKKNNLPDEVKNLSINQLVNFENHPFKVETNTELFELMHYALMEQEVEVRMTNFAMIINDLFKAEDKNEYIRHLSNYGFLLNLSYML